MMDQGPAPTSQLLDAARAGDESAIGTLLERHAHPLRARIERELPVRFQSLLSADDVLQQTFVDAFRDLPAFAGADEAALSRWLWAITRRNLIDAVRALESEKRGGDRLRLDPAGLSVSAWVDLFRTVSGPSRAVSLAEAEAALRKALQQLPPDYRRCVEHLDLDGCPVESLATALGRSKGACYMMRARALRMLREFLGQTSGFL